MAKKPVIFEAASIFSIIGSSIGFVGMFLAAIFFQAAVAKITQLTNITATENLNPVYFAVLGTAFSISLIGAIKLFRAQRSGVYFYLIGQLAVMFIPVIHLGSDAFSPTNAIFTILFSGVYLYHFKRLNG
jgi:hypothetical protein